MGISQRFSHLQRALESIRVTDKQGSPVKLEKAVEQFLLSFKGKLIFVGNGGSAAISSHMAIDYTKNGKQRAIAFNDSSYLTCAANDYGYEHGFSMLTEMYADKGDILIGISSSGKSVNILNACHTARKMGCLVYTLSGFGAANPLRSLGDLNFYVPATDYGTVEIAHLAILHGILDTHMGIK